MPIIWFVILLSAQTTFAGINDLRADLNGFYSDFLQGNCQNMRSRVCSVDQKQGNLEHLIQSMSQISYNEETYFPTAAQQQMEFLRCDKDKLALMSKRDPKSMTFQRTVLDDLAMKLPEMRIHYKRATEAAAQAKELQAQIDAIYASINRSTETMDHGMPRIKAINVQLKKVMDVLVPESGLFNTIYSSIWRSDNPYMESFILRAINSPKAPDDIAHEALQEDADNGILGYKLILGDKLSIGASEFSFQEQVLNRMAEQNQKDIDTLTDQSVDKKGSKFRASDFSFPVKRMLVKNSEWASMVANRAEEGNVDSAVFMCEMDHRYVSGDDATVSTMEIGAALVTGGSGVLAETIALSKFARLLSPLALRAVLAASEVYSTSSVFLGSMGAALMIKDECFAGRPVAVYSGRNECSQKDIQDFDELEKIRVQKENCVLAVVTGVANGSQVLHIGQHALESNFVKKLSAFRKLPPKKP